ncbi:hypothetical protein ARHIZOSPH14_08960 [Agromyces rhizosphaerae]|uniref:Uncharacterized protein n=1 Tax=Agromyces rhizosphaerae TaxID=88374 RepID=A0A9W6FN69_9MICO|nr:hypothetical protein [Agromyces rhizosphaerae]GLI26654.1 hypothetical protein ARHIZOSPH14_08960 [Agromyces rhizosphaerae]
MESIKAFCLDVNWVCRTEFTSHSTNEFAPPGAWASLNPADQVQWHKDLGVNVIQTFAVSSNGYAWYKNGRVPEQPGLESDYLTEMVRIGRAEGLEVFGYFCFGSNTRWATTHPELSYGTPSAPHIPYTRAYIDFLCESIREAIELTDMDGYMIDWFWSPTTGLGVDGAGTSEQRWLACEQEMYRELMGEPFPGAAAVTEEMQLTFNRRAIDRCWQAVKATTRAVKPSCKIWLSCSILDHPEIVRQPLLREVDWLQNEAGDKRAIDEVRSQIGEQTELLTTFSDSFFQRNSLQGEDVVAYAEEEGIGLYCYAAPETYDAGFPPVADFLRTPLDDFAHLDDRNIALLARVFHQS